MLVLMFDSFFPNLYIPSLTKFYFMLSLNYLIFSTSSSLQPIPSSQWNYLHYSSIRRPLLWLQQHIHSELHQSHFLLPPGPSSVPALAQFSLSFRSAPMVLSLFWTLPGLKFNTISISLFFKCSCGSSHQLDLVLCFKSLTVASQLL